MRDTPSLVSRHLQKKCHTEVTDTMVSTFFPSDPLIRHVEEVLRAALKMCEEVERESLVTEAMGSRCSDINMGPTTPVTLRSTCLSDTEDSYNISRLNAKSGLDTTT